MTRSADTLTLITRRLLAALVLLVFGYGAAGLLGGALPAHAGWRQPPRGVTIWVESNGIHTGLVLPKVAAGIDWRGFAPARDLADPRYARYGYLSVGWGDHDFYLSTPSWADVRPGTVLAAAVGSSRTLLHVEHVPLPRVALDTRAIVLRPEEYRRLAAYIVATRGSAQRWPGYAGNDIFYGARGRYSALRTCNSWTGAALRAAGVRVGRWTPFPVTVLGWF